MKTLNNKTVFQCEYCTRVSLSAGGIKRHEVGCKKNPNNLTPCASCTYCERIDNSYQEGIEDYFGTTYERTIKRFEFICHFDGAKMYHNKVNRMSKVTKDIIISQCDRQMPLECSHYREELYGVDNLDFDIDNQV